MLSHARTGTGTLRLYVADLQGTQWLVCRQAISLLLTRGQGRQELRPERSGQGCQARCLGSAEPQTPIHWQAVPRIHTHASSRDTA